MDVQVAIPSSLRRFCNGNAVVGVDAGTVPDALRRLADLHPALGTNILSAGGAPHSFIRVFVNAKDYRRAADQPLQSGDTISIVTAFSGG